MTDVNSGSSPAATAPRTTITDGGTSTGPNYSSEDISRYLQTGSLDKPIDPVERLASEEDTPSHRTEDAEELSPSQQGDEREAEEVDGEKISKKTFQKRLNKEVAKTKQLSAQLASLQENLQELQSQNHKYVALIQTLAQNEEKFQSVQSPSDQELLQYKMREEMQKRLQQLESDYQTKIQEAQKQAKVESYTEILLEEVQSAQEQYPLAHPQDILYYAEVHPRASIAEIAQKLHQQAQSKLGQTKSFVPKPTSSGSNMSYQYDEDGVASFLRNNR